MRCSNILYCLLWPRPNVIGPQKTGLIYLHVKFDLNFSLSNVISQLGNIASKFHHIAASYAQNHMELNITYRNWIPHTDKKICTIT